MTLQSCLEYTELSKDEDEHEEEPELFAEGYLETIADCQALAVNLLQKAINNVDVKRCWDCISWCGRCAKGKLNLIACSEACDEFTPRLPKKGDSDV